MPPSSDPSTVNFILYIVFVAGGGGALGWLYKFVADARHGKVESAKTLAARIEAQSARDDKRAEDAEASEAAMRGERDRALDQAAVYRRELIAHNIPIPEVPTP